MGTVVRLYLDWRLLRLARPLLAAALLAAAMLALYAGYVPANGRAERSLRGGATAIARELSRAVERGFARARR